jgi:diguanylate cyclase (GGDEF)-like protein
MYFEIRETDIDRHLQSEEAKALLAAWRLLAFGGSLPTVDRLWNTDLPSRAHLLLVLPEGEDDWRYAICGEALAKEEGRHWEVELASELAEPDRSFVRRVFTLTARRGDAVYAVHSAPNSHNVLLWERLMLPCRNAEGRIAIVTLLKPIEYVEDMIRAVLDSTPTAILRARCIRDAEGRVVDAVCLLANELAQTFMRRTAAELDQGCILELFPSFLETGVFATFVDVAETRRPRHFEMHYRDGQETSWFAVSVMPLGDGFTLSLADITARKQIHLQLEHARNELLQANADLERQAAELEAAITAANAARADLEAEVECRKVLEEELRRLALTDALTGLANRPAIAAQGQGLAASAQKRNQPLSVVAIDLDHFKQINDRHGHAAGDRVLAGLAGLMEEACRRGLDIPGRLGGEEFVIILPRTDVDGAAAFAEGLRRRVAEHVFQAGEQDVHITASLGVAQFLPGEEFEDLLARCDEALYRAKRDGRNRVVRAIEAETLAA